MRIAKAEIFGKERTLCFSMRVMQDAEERYGDLAKMFDSLGSGSMGKQFGEICWLLSAMLAAGDKYNRLNGIDAEPAALSEDELLDICGADDLTMLQEAISKAILDGSAREVEATPPKNAEATPPTR